MFHHLSQHTFNPLLQERTDFRQTGRVDCAAWQSNTMFHGNAQTPNVITTRLLWIVINPVQNRRQKSTTILVHMG
jgi:hypothetical protein